ncbi:MAG: hypothetical protein RIQ89_1953 [Bacteroidota bacterium]|jgi:L-asparaginase / beta-aspartyl-peptidase
MKYALALHGGAGTITRNQLSAEQERLYKNALEKALKLGIAILRGGGKSIDAVVQTVMYLENDDLFNAGKGSVFTHHGTHEMDASVMEGRTLKAGAVAGLHSIKNPVLAALHVMEHTEHVLLAGSQANQYLSQHLTTVNHDYFFSDYRFNQWQQALKDDKVVMDHTEKKFGTVGAVALDHNGDLAAATSTGGMTNKKFGRVGDTPLIGSGTYANNNTCAISCTGHGEFFIRSVVAYDISCLIEYKGLSLADACNEVVKNKLNNIGGEGGLIALDKNGIPALVFNSEGMYRAAEGSNFEKLIAIYND